MGIIQIDSVNVLVRSQELPVFARLGAHPRTLIDDATGAGELFEYWVHEASHVPTADHHLYRWRMASPHRWGAFRRLMADRAGYVEQVLRHVEAEGPVVAGDLRQRQGPKAPWWDYDDGKLALEALFHEGRLTAYRRSNDFARVYDLTERVIPAEHLAIPTPSEAEARKELLVRAAKHHGVATFEDLTDYHRQRNPPCRPLIAELVEEGRLVEASVEGWTKPAYVHPEAVMPRRVSARTLLSPFDPLVWNRDRVERLFGFRYRIEIYVPEAKREYGYYVLPFLLGDELVARVDLKADRRSGRLLVQSAFGEPGIHESDVADELAAELDFDGGLARVSTTGSSSHRVVTWRRRCDASWRRSARTAHHGELRTGDVGEGDRVLVGIERHLRCPDRLAALRGVDAQADTGGRVELAGVHRRCKALRDHGDDVASGLGVAVDCDEHLGVPAVEQHFVVRFGRDDRVVERAARAAFGNLGRRIVAAARCSDRSECDDGADGGEATTSRRGGCTHAPDGISRMMA